MMSLAALLRWCLSASLVVAGGCDRETQPAADKGQDEPVLAPAAPARERVFVSATLLDHGRVQLTKVVESSYAGSLIVPGEVAPGVDGEAELGPLVGGRIASLEVAEGASVQKGQVLAWIEAPEVGDMQAQFARSSARVTASQRQLERQLALFEQNATSERALDDARVAARVAEAEQQAARARLAALGASTVAGAGSKLPLRSPINGTVVERRASLGAAVTPQAAIFRIVDLKQQRVKAQWSETLGGVPAVGTPVTLVSRHATHPKSTAPPCKGKVNAHLGVVDRRTRSLTLQIEPDPSCSGLSHGAYVEVMLSTAADTDPKVDGGPTTARVQVPTHSVVELRGVPTVFVALPDPGWFEVRRVLPEPSAGAMTTISAGLIPGEQVASKGLILLKGEALRGVLGGD